MSNSEILANTGTDAENADEDYDPWEAAMPPVRLPRDYEDVAMILTELIDERGTNWLMDQLQALQNAMQSKDEAYKPLPRRVAAIVEFRPDDVRDALSAKLFADGIAQETRMRLLRAWREDSSKTAKKGEL